MLTGCRWPARATVLLRSAEDVRACGGDAGKGRGRAVLTAWAPPALAITPADEVAADLDTLAIQVNDPRFRHTRRGVARQLDRAVPMVRGIRNLHDEQRVGRRRDVLAVACERRS